MHVPSREPRPSVFYEYQVHAFRRTPDMDTGRAGAPVVIVGAGPIGLLTAIDLARYGVASILLEQDLQVCHGSRAIVLTRRSLEILQQVGVDPPFCRKGLPRKDGNPFEAGRGTTGSVTAIGKRCDPYGRQAQSQSQSVKHNFMD